jgi:uncharacterized protein YjbI with pentapeptide repeats
MAKERFPSALEPRLSDLVETSELQLESEDEIEALHVQNVSFDGEADFVELTNSHFDRVVFTGSLFNKLSVVDVIFEDCEFSAAVFEDSTLTRVQFRRCRLSGISAPALKARDVSFIECKLDQANFRMTEWERCQLIECDLQDAEFIDAIFRITQMRNCLLDHAEFSFARVESLSLHGSRLDDLRGAEHLRNAVIRSDQVAVLAMSLLASAGIEVDDNS